MLAFSWHRLSALTFWLYDMMLTMKAAQGWGWSYGELVEVRFWRGREGVAVARVVCVHGVGQQLKGEDSLAGEWALALRDGMRRAGCAEARLPGPGRSGACFTGMCSVLLAEGWRWGIRG